MPKLFLPTAFSATGVSRADARYHAELTLALAPQWVCKHVELPGGTKRLIWYIPLQNAGRRK
jgi:hypothetical protein